jgi:hypothetical protein
MTITELYNETNYTKQESKQLRKEYRYVLIIQLEHEGKLYSSSNKNPVNDLKLAKEIALKNFHVNFNITNKDNIIIRGFKYLYADVPINDIILGTKNEMQCISCKSLTEQEIKSI